MGTEDYEHPRRGVLGAGIRVLASGCSLQAMRLRAAYAGEEPRRSPRWSGDQAPGPSHVSKYSFLGC